MGMEADYRKEREDIETLEFPHGFITYKFFPTECYIVDIYVRPEMRKTGYGSMMADHVKKIAQTQGYQILTGSVDTRLPSAMKSADILKKYGFKHYKDVPPMTYFVMEIL